MTPLKPGAGEDSTTFVARWDSITRLCPAPDMESLIQTVPAPCKLCKLGTKPGKIQICLPALPYNGVHFTTATYLCASCDKSYGKGIDKGLCHRLWREKNCRKVDYAGWMDQRVIRLVCSRGHDKRNSCGCMGSPGLWWVVSVVSGKLSAMLPMMPTPPTALPW